MNQKIHSRLLHSSDGTPHLLPLELPEIEDRWEEGIHTPMIPASQIRRLQQQIQHPK